ncbi:(2Fe-2S)-binding protein [Acetobacter musti]|uniref:(2Fe-2S)-binding protein n=1 Tax=Acetobacter musti TaxID=864732 RepID=A0ABX0JK45_9PROT|nr:2Fe-2S iron-sulfur cluster-binding protein [Acetobacter musti]NHN83262.1 (2Fe-2S)-binding protein [Acetobacter musti]
MTLLVNGVVAPEPDDPDMSLVDFLRGACGAVSCRPACRVGRCGGCMVLLDGEAVNACLIRMWRLDGRDTEIVTLEGIGRYPEGRILQEEMIAHTAFQCGYCAPGFIMAALPFLIGDDPEAGEIPVVLAGNICRCTGYRSIGYALERAVSRVRAERSGCRADEAAAG